jgi:hypothetical protein
MFTGTGTSSLGDPHPIKGGCFSGWPIQICFYRDVRAASMFADVVQIGLPTGTAEELCRAHGMVIEKLASGTLSPIRRAKSIHCWKLAWN